MEVSKANSKWNKHIIFSPEAFRGKHEWVSRVDLACVPATSVAPNVNQNEVDCFGWEAESRAVRWVFAD